MKSIFIFCAFGMSMFLSEFQLKAVKNFIYDGDEFSILLTYDSSDTKIEKISFSYNNEWVGFNIISFEDLEDVDDGGFYYTLKDAKGNIFYLDYYRTIDEIHFSNESGKEWILKRREDK